MGWMRVSKSEPCKICKHPDWCQRGDYAAHCMRLESNRPAKGGGWIHVFDGINLSQVAKLPPPKPAKSDAEYYAIWGPHARKWFMNQVESIERLATILGVEKDALDMLHVGYDDREKCWIFPERNGEGLTVGVTRRFEDGKKLCAIGSRRGLTYADDWSDWPGPCYIVEGASDVAAGLTIGLCVVGRPSNVGGIEYLTKLLVEFPRAIIVLGERDKRDHDTLKPQMQVGHDEDCHGCPRCWSGLYGAELTAENLRKRLNREVSISFPPDHAKDLRAWLNERNSMPRAIGLLGVWNYSDF